MTSELELKIEGMHCSSCSRLIESALLDHAGVINARIDHEGGTGTVAVDLDLISREQLIELISGEGYSATITGDSDEGAQAPIEIREQAVPRRALEPRASR